ncbi:hypothetical protein FSP39_025390 [Pinctada imbricata]|uniref:Uncharacterized protein n=1 Tax=Pinctada imbricata TaxID=66713 RepID=A0AA89BV72_PINIB|nr:hypothetical protein FSP39_025390 [Pinctada imbricata]
MESKEMLKRMGKMCVGGRGYFSYLSSFIFKKSQRVYIWTHSELDTGFRKDRGLGLLKPWSAGPRRSTPVVGSLGGDDPIDIKLIKILEFFEQKRLIGKWYTTNHIQNRRNDVTSIFKHRKRPNDGVSQDLKALHTVHKASIDQKESHLAPKQIRPVTFCINEPQIVEKCLSPRCTNEIPSRLLLMDANHQKKEDVKPSGQKESLEREL